MPTAEPENACTRLRVSGDPFAIPTDRWPDAPPTRCRGGRSPQARCRRPHSTAAAGGRAAARHRHHRRVDRAAGDQCVAADHQHGGDDGLECALRALYEIKRALITFQSVITAAESSQRGYLLTGQTDYLEPYHVAMRSWRNQIDRLRELTVDDPKPSGRHHVAGGADDGGGEPPRTDHSQQPAAGAARQRGRRRHRSRDARRWTGCAASSIA